MSSLEKLTHDLIDDDFFMTFKPVYVTKCILGSTRFHIKDKFISATTVKQRMLTTVMVTLSTWAAYFTFNSKSFEVFLIDKSSLYLMDLGILQFFLTCALYLAIIIPNAFLHRDQNVMLFILLQNIDRYLKLNKCSGSYKKQFTKVFVMIVGIILFYLSWYIWYVLFYKKDEFLFIGLGFIAFIVIEVEMIAFGSILQFLILRLKYVNKLLKEKSEIKWRNLIKNSTNDNSQKEIDLNYFKAFEYIIIAYELLQKLYGLYVSIVFAFFY